MSTDSLTEVIPVAPDKGDLPVGRYRPVLPSRPHLTLIRRFVGVREDILDWVPEERARYSRLGAIVLNTGLMAAVSLFVALHILTTAPLYVQIPVSLFWGYLIVSFDGWLIAGTHGVLNRAKIWVFLPRMIVSLLMGAVIAEPLVLAVLQPTVLHEVKAERQDDVTSFNALLTKCNPPTGAVVTAPECRGHQVSFADSPGTVRSQLATTTTDRDQAQKLVDSINTQLAALQTAAQNECAGTSGTGFTGKRGQGPNCARDRQVADQYRTDSQLDQHESDVTALDAKINTLTAQLADNNGKYGNEVAAWIAAQTKQHQDDQGPIGFLDEEKALNVLSDKNVSVAVDQWMLRLLLIAIDLMPALVKLFSGTTVYDQLYTRQLEATRKLHAKYVEVRTQRDTADHDVHLRHIAQNLQSRLSRFHDEDMSGRAQREADLDAQIETLAARLRAQGGTGGEYY